MEFPLVMIEEARPDLVAIVAGFDALSRLQVEIIAEDHEHAWVRAAAERYLRGAAEVVAFTNDGAELFFTGPAVGVLMVEFEGFE